MPLVRRTHAFLRRFVARTDGYTLVVVASLMAALGVGTTAYLDQFVVTQQAQRQLAARQQISRLVSALAQYEYYHGSYPCPASVVQPPGSTSFGAPETNCATGTAAGIAQLSGSTQVIRGMVPVRALAPYGIESEDAFDPWGSRYMYVINRQLTPLGNGVATAAPSLTHASLSTNLSTPSVLVISYGRDRRGGYLRSQSGASLAAGPSVACTNDTELRGRNCGDHLYFVMGGSNTGSTVPASAYFDDVISFLVRNGSCRAQPVVWGGGSECATSSTNLGNGASAVLPNTNVGYNGTITVTCTNGVLSRSSASCFADPLHGGWTGWSECSATQCGQTGSRTRSCTNPPPTNGGLPCSGAAMESCTIAPCVSPCSPGQCEVNSVCGGTQCLNTGDGYIDSTDPCRKSYICNNGVLVYQGQNSHCSDASSCI